VSFLGLGTANIRRLQFQTSEFGFGMKGYMSQGEEFICGKMRPGSHRCKAFNRKVREERPQRALRKGVWPRHLLALLLLLLLLRRGSLSLGRSLASLLIEALEDGGDDQGQSNGGIDEDFAESAAFRRRDKLAPGNCLAIGAA